MPCTPYAGFQSIGKSAARRLRPQARLLGLTDNERRFLGMVSLEEAHLASRLSNLASTVLAADLMRSDVVPLHPNDRLDQAMELFAENDLLELPVVDDTPDRRVIGIVTRATIAGAYLRRVHGTPKTA